MKERKILGLSIITALREYCIDQQKYYGCDRCIFSNRNNCIITIPSEQVILNLKNKLATN